uniref:Uncharacterized protein n=1 Tax=Rhizophagus irregularis (strain DAOM 181602 / DAOM 197198 / MUCL 43194) TaxID=747089 RepID=U9TUM3_RHIID
MFSQLWTVVLKKDIFFYPDEYGIAIELASNSIWCWLTKAVHGTRQKLPSSSLIMKTLFYYMNSSDGELDLII